VRLGNRNWGNSRGRVNRGEPDPCAPGVRRVMMLALDEVLARLEGVRASSGYYVARCPAHSDRNASLSIRKSEGGKVLIKCFAGCGYRTIIVALNVRPCRPKLGFPRASPTDAESDAARQRRNGEYARRIWLEARTAAGTLVERYLQCRGITIPVPASLRFHPSLRHPTGANAPAMVAAVQTDSRIVAVHRTWLSADGSAKADLIPPRAALGPVRGCSIRFAKATERLALAEGVETALSVAQACPALPVWCAISASNLPAVELPTCIREVVVAADGDDAGERAARAAAEGFMREGRRAFIARPEPGCDFNDYLRFEDA